MASHSITAAARPLALYCEKWDSTNCSFRIIRVNSCLANSYCGKKHVITVFEHWSCTWIMYYLPIHMSKCTGMHWKRSPFLAFALILHLLHLCHVVCRNFSSNFFFSKETVLVIRSGTLIKSLWWALSCVALTMCGKSTAWSIFN